MSGNATGYFANGRNEWYGGWYGGGNVHNGGVLGCINGLEGGSNGYEAYLNVDHHHTVTAEGTIGYTGSNIAHENMPPYIAKYCWERTA